MKTPNYDGKVDSYALGIILFELMNVFPYDTVRFSAIEKLKSSLRNESINPINPEYEHFVSNLNLRKSYV